MGRLELPDRYNVGADLLDRTLAAGRENKIAIYSAAKDVTYGELFKLSCGAAHALHDLGVRREERILIVGYDGPGWVAAFLGAIRLGAIPVPVNPLLQRSEDYDHYIEDSLARVVVVGADTGRGRGRPSSHACCARTTARPPPKQPPPRQERTTWPSGSTAPARPASRRPSSTSSTTSRTPASPTPSRCSASPSATSRSRPPASSMPMALATTSPFLTGWGLPRSCTPGETHPRPCL